MITASLSLALCTIMFRRFMDTYTGRIPLAIQSSAAPNTTAIFMLSGALYYLYNHLKKGTLVRIGQGHPRHVSLSRSSIQRRGKNNSWFLRNARACRKKCTDAVYRIAKQSYESLHNLNPCLLLPNRSFQISFSKAKSSSSIEENNYDRKKNLCNIIYSNEAFSKDSNQDVKSTQPGLENEPPPVVPKRRGRRSIVKRLNEGLKTKDELNTTHVIFQRKSKPFKRMTRSGRVYSSVE